jgi:hypothetical protein
MKWLSLALTGLQMCLGLIVVYDEQFPDDGYRLSALEVFYIVSILAPWAFFAARYPFRRSSELLNLWVERKSLEQRLKIQELKKDLSVSPTEKMKR